MSQALLAFFGLCALWLAYGSERQRKWSPLVGLCGQPWWFFSLEPGQTGMMVVTLAYTGVFARQAYINWRHAWMH
jgi:hypothetical protein